MNIDKLVLYRQNQDTLFYRFSNMIYKVKQKEIIALEENAAFYQCIYELVEEGVSHGFYGNLWHCYLTHRMVSNENVYSRSCEMTGDVGGAISRVAMGDFEILKELFDFDLTSLQEFFPYDYENLIAFDNSKDIGNVFNHRIRDCICDLAIALEHTENVAEFQSQVAGFYKSFGVGKFGLHKAFRIGEDGEIIPITNIAHVQLEDLVGYEIQKKKLIDNTEAFVYGKKANNCLMFGDAGTGKSSSIKAIINRYYDDGLRMIEVYKHQFKDLNSVIAQIKNRNYKFIIYMDDLSFEEFEIEYKYLKAVIEGGLEKKPDNVLIYATSNRRHLVRETFKDKSEYDDLHKNDTVQEKLSLVARFGVTIYFGSPSKKEFEHIVLTLKNKYHLTISDEEILKEANKWEMSHGGLSGRTAQQFIDYLSGQEGA